MAEYYSCNYNCSNNSIYEFMERCIMAINSDKG